MNNSEIADTIAIKIMGWWEVSDELGNHWWYTGKKTRILGSEHEYDERIHRYAEWNPVEDANHCIRLVERMIELGFNPQIQYNEDTRMWCVIMWPGSRFDDETKAVAEHDKSIRKAVCLVSIDAIEALKND
jgi:hypothetical protein